ncbi:hypothetical protein [Tabrizicola sp.]|uniref:rolling circle replication-associated protein n=1 Tax=Tabrizicola sp. TaxID=2005166 RepID=UPI00263117B9|nr:hypothetical protein [Tabrizicola sp.]MDM7930892.1 hypothetical protein [Tabrizicola sp.]
MHPHIHHFAHHLVLPNPVALTLTMKQADQWGTLDQIEARRNFGFFMNRLNRKVYGNAFTRYGRRLGVVPVLERSPGGRLHYHASIENPYDDLPTFSEAVLASWTKTRWGYHEVDVQRQFSSGWIDYILKSQDFDALDVENLHTVC